MQTKIPCVMMRGGTSKGTYFLASDLPADEQVRDQVLLSVMGSPDDRQIDGVGGANPLTSKVAVVKKSDRPGVDVDYLFIQVVVDEPRTSTVQNCGNILAGVGQFALESGLVEPSDGETTLTIFMENSDSLADVTFPSPGGVPSFDGDARIDGVPGTAAPVMINFRDTEGSACGSLLPTGNLIDTVQGIDVTCIDNGMPIVLFTAESMGRTGYESRDELNADTELKKRIEALRLEVGHMMNLDDVTEKTIPKMTMIAAPQNGGAICTRSFIPHDCHAAIGVFAAVSVGTACAMPGTVAYDIAEIPNGDTKLVSVEHPTGEFSVEMEIDSSGDKPQVKRAALLRTARRLFEGQVLIPQSVWSGTDGKLAAAAE
jgi:4-oxalomesaconate tautomerase